MDLSFNLPEPGATDIRPINKLWGTFYYIKFVSETASGVPILNENGAAIGPTISSRNWCLAGIEGTVAIKKKDGSKALFNFAGSKGPSQTSCKAVVPDFSDSELAALEGTRYQPAKGPYGDGAGKFILAPFRSIAVDKKVIPLGSAIYVPAARGVKISLPTGGTATHDGYFFAADVGGKIKGRHVDFFLGLTESNPFKFITSDSNGKFTAFAVTNKATIAFLKGVHTP